MATTKRKPKPRRSGATIPEDERRAKGQRLLQVRLGADDAELLTRLPLPGETEPAAVRRAIRSTVAAQISSKLGPSEKSTRPIK